MLLWLLACGPKTPPESAVAADPPFQREVVEGTAIWKIEADEAMARDLMGEDWVLGCLDKLEMGYEICAATTDCLTVVVSKDDQVRTLVALSPGACEVHGGQALDKDQQLPVVPLGACCEMPEH